VQTSKFARLDFSKLEPRVEARAFRFAIRFVL